MRAPALAAARARDRDIRAEVAAGDDHGHAARDMGETEIEQGSALGIGEQELLRVVGQDADAVDALIDHAVEHPALTLRIEIACRGERGRRDREHARVGLALGKARHVIRLAAGGSVVSLRPLQHSRRARGALAVLVTDAARGRPAEAFGNGRNPVRSSPSA